MNFNHNAIFNLKAVLKETGIKPDVLRAWERRYGLPMPRRTAGGHRLYSEYDINMIKWLLARQHDGLSISHAVDMWKSHLKSGEDPLRSVALSTQNTAQTKTIQHVEALSGMDDFRAQWLNACFAFNESAAEQILNQAFAMYPVEVVCMEILQRSMVEVGRMWYQNAATIQQEHFASSLAIRRLEALLHASPAPTRPEILIVGCPANEWHTFIPLMLTLFIRRRGYNVVYLGSNVPLTHFAETARVINASLVVLTAQQLNTAASLREISLDLYQYGCQVAFGGRIFSSHPGLVNKIPGHYLGNKLEAIMDMIENLVALQPPPPAPVMPAEKYGLALRAFITNRTHIESTLDQTLGPRMASSQYVADARIYLGENIISALKLGDMQVLDHEIDWLKILIQSFNLPPSILHAYLQAYAASLKHYIKDEGQPIIEWFDRQLQVDNN